MSGSSDYQVFGLRVRSEIPLPELFAAIGEGVPDVMIRRTVLSTPERESRLTRDGDALVLSVQDVGRYRVTGGREIVAEAAQGVPDRNLRLFLLGSAFGALLHQRGLLPLHANAVEIGGRAVAFMGPSGAGKSTLAAWFHDLGFRVIADDVCVIGFDRSEEPYAMPGLPRLRLWSEALELMGRQSKDYERSYVGAAQEYDKFDVPVEPDASSCSNLSLAAVYLLDRVSDPSIKQLGGIDAAQAIFENTYRGRFLDEIGGQQRHWQSAVRLVQSTPIFRASRQWDLAGLTDENQKLLDHAVAVVAPA